jgi:acetate kinase
VHFPANIVESTGQSLSWYDIDGQRIARMNVLVVNSGSSSLKVQVISTDLERIKQHKDDRLCRGEVEGIGGEAIIKFQGRQGESRKFTASLRDMSAALDYLVRYIASERSGIAEIKSAADLHAVGHRVVHGGELFSESALIDDKVLQGIEDCIDLAPLHNPNNIKGILAARELFGKTVPQVAVFDTSFHHSIPEQAYLYAVPYHLYRRHRIRRYGFHGTSHRYVAFRYRALRGLSREQTNIISLHLGNGCSAAAIRGGSSVDTSMGMTPLEGLVMGTRSGDLDPAIVNVIARKEGMSSSEVDMLLNTQSGLLGISGLTHDMRELQAELKEHEDRRVRLAVEVFCYRARKYIGAFLACMGGADAVVFTGGIGENSPEIRALICGGMEWAGLKLDATRNRQAVGCEGKICTEDSRLLAYAIPTDEELLIARDTVRVILGEPHPS